MYRQIIKKIQTSGYQAYLVGGCVRDMLLGKNPNDFDITTNAKYNQLRKIFSDKEIDPIGKQFQVIIVDGFEIATYRVDQYDTNGNLVSTIPVSDLSMDLSRRDLTINSMAINPITNEVIDLFNGQEDLKKGIIRFTGNANQRIIEDPLRIIRACRFLSTMQFRFSKDTFFALRNNAELIKNIPFERINCEITKALKHSENPSNFFRALYNIGCLEYIFPSIHALYNHDGGKFHNETIFEHSMDALDNIKVNNTNLKLAALLHDIGKPMAFLLYSNGSFKGHDKIGSEMAVEELKRLKFSNDTIEYVKNMVSVHMANFNLDSTDRVVRRLLSKFDTLGINWEDFLLFRYADHEANQKHTPYEIFEKQSFYNKFQSVIDKQEAFSIKDLAINGKDVMEFFNIGPSKQVGIILKNLFEYVLNDPSLNTKNSLIEIMKSLPN